VWIGVLPILNSFIDRCPACCRFDLRASAKLFLLQFVGNRKLSRCLVAVRSSLVSDRAFQRRILRIDFEVLHVDIAQ